ncbi:hypothetical protein JCM5353_003403 [Sporobolomyces roseus]
MLRTIQIPIELPQLARPSIRCSSSSSTNFPPPPQLSTLSTPQDMKQAREWISQFNNTPPSTWPKHLYETSFSRSSGPGGQHVNRTLSKAILRLLLPSSSFLPAYLLPHLRSSPYYSSSPPSLLLSSSTTRSQSSNLEECFKKLKGVVLEAAEKDLVGETSDQQKERVKGLVLKEKAKLVKVKKMRKDVKGGRGKVKGWE